MVSAIAMHIVAAALLSQQPLKGLDPLFPGGTPPPPRAEAAPGAAAPADPRAVEARVAVAEGIRLLNESKFDAALAAFKKAADLDPQNAYAFAGGGSCYYAAGKIDIAIEAFKKAIERDPGMSAAYFNLGRCYAVKKQMEMAIIQYGKAIKDNPQYGAAYFELANAYYINKDFKNARINYEKAASIFGEKTPQGEEALRNAIKVETLMKRLGG